MTNCKAVSNVNVRMCMACKMDKHMVHFPLVYPDDPSDFRRLTICDKCTKKAKALLRKSSAYKAYRKVIRKEKKRPQQNAIMARRRAMKRNAMPRWANRKEIKEFFRVATELTKTTGIKHHVDHIIPLVHPMVCGLHVPYNLQILTAEENLKKSNHFVVG